MSPTEFAKPSDYRVRVRRPEPTDGVGDALRQVFGASCSLPGEFCLLLCRLERC